MHAAALHPAAALRPLDVFVCGAQKGGTTALYAYLAAHPGMSAPGRKELHLFDPPHGAPQEDEAALLARIARHFPVEDAGRLRFDATPISCFWPGAMARILRHNPEARLILLLRDPLHRAWSHWGMSVVQGHETMPFAAAIREGRQRLIGPPGSATAEPHQAAWRNFSYVERGFYGAQLARMRAWFPAEQILCLRSEDLAGDAQGTLGRITDFLGLAPFPVVVSLRVHERSAPPAPGPSLQDRDLLRHLYAEDLALCARLSELEIAHWCEELP